MSARTSTADDALTQLRTLCASVGFDLESAGGALADRMKLLAELSRTFDDAARMASYAERVFRLYEDRAPDAVFSPIERTTVVLACLLSDVGKTGPEAADAEARRVVAEAFAVENVRDDAQSMESFLRTHFPEDAERRAARLAAVGVGGSMPLRQFWNLHTGWTLAILEAASVPPEAVAAAATHHLLEDVNPGAIVGVGGRFTRRFGDNTAFDRAEKLVIVLDKYDAARRRGGRTHEEAIAWLEERLAASERARDDREFQQLVADVRDALAPRSGER